MTGNFNNTRITRNPFILFLPFFVIYSICVFLLQHHELWGDEIRHFGQAQNLLHGFYSPPPPNIDLGNGPGYPLLLVPFLALHIPLIFVKLLNALFLYLTIVLLFKILSGYVSFRVTLLFCLFWGCYYNSLNFIALVYAEAFAVFLVTLMAYLMIKVFDQAKGKQVVKHIVLCGLVTGYLVLTKVIFGYVILVIFAATCVLWLFNRRIAAYRKVTMVLLIAFATVMPYLAYTYKISGKLFYWSTSGGNNLYWMSTPYAGEYGNWFSGNTILESDSTITIASKDRKMVREEAAGLINNGLDSLKAHHLANYRRFFKYKGVPQDDAFKETAMDNIKKHPFKFIQNCFSNAGRMLFNYPYSYSPQKPATLARLPLNGIILLLALLCLVPTLVNWRKIDFPVRFLLLFALIYLGGSIFGSAEIRMFTVVVPLLLTWIAFVAYRTIKINFRFQSEKTGN